MTSYKEFAYSLRINPDESESYALITRLIETRNVLTMAVQYLQDSQAEIAQHGHRAIDELTDAMHSITNGHRGAMNNNTREICIHLQEQAAHYARQADEWRDTHHDQGASDWPDELDNAYENALAYQRMAARDYAQARSIITKEQT